MVVLEARNDRASSKNQVWGPIQDSGPPLLSAQAGGYVLHQPNISPGIAQCHSGMAPDRQGEIIQMESLLYHWGKARAARCCQTHELSPNSLTAIPRAARADFFTFFLVAGPVRNAPERSWHASGLIFSPNRRFWTQFGPFLMVLARTDIFGWT